MNREFGSEFDVIQLPDNYFTKNSKLFHRGMFLRSGRETLSLIAESIIGNKVVLLPSYSCPTMSYPFLSRGWTIAYYNIKKDLFIDQDSLLSNIKIYRPSLVLIMSYFCSIDYSNIALSIKQIDSKIKIIYDFTQCVFSISSIMSNQIDYYVASLRKWFGVASGAWLLTDEYINDQIIENDSTIYISQKINALIEKERYLYTANKKLKNSFKRNIKEADLLLGYDHIYYADNKDVKRLLSINIESVRISRKENLLHLWRIIQDIDFIEPLFDYNNREMDFMLPVLIKDQKKVQTSLSNNGVFCQVVWPILDEARKDSCADYISKHIDLKLNIESLQVITIGILNKLD